MNQIVMSICLGFMSIAASASQWGEKLEIATIDSIPAIEMEYHYSSRVYWSLRYTSTLTENEIANLPTKIRFKLVNLRTNQVLIEQMALKETLLRPSLIYGSELNLFVKKFLTEQTQFALVFTDAQDQALYHLPIIDVCSQYPEHVFNLSQPKNSPCVVRSSEFSNEPNACSSQQVMLEKYIEHGWFTCKSAQNVWDYIDCDKKIICTP